ncbi:hypothetical protein [Roseofilum sp. Guam]|nr:hypothetical protein [Roseofilum sp. Guam]MBP0028194.1 hypothetical protein [Roseofilum sp. Guam]
MKRQSKGDNATHRWRERLKFKQQLNLDLEGLNHFLGNTQDNWRTPEI